MQLKAIILILFLSTSCSNKNDQWTYISCELSWGSLLFDEEVLTFRFKHNNKQLVRHMGMDISEKNYDYIWTNPQGYYVFSDEKEIDEEFVFYHPGFQLIEIKGISPQIKYAGKCRNS